MKKFDILDRIKGLYDRGENIIGYLKSQDQRETNTLEDILISYDFQAGSYIAHAENHQEFANAYAKAIASEIKKLGTPKSVLEVGVGEATKLGKVALEFSEQVAFGGFDISWSRIYYASKYTKGLGVKAFLCTGDLFCSPFSDSSIDIVYTSHSIEPNGGREAEAIAELYRITNQYLVLLEPSFEMASPEDQQRMIRNGYVRNLKGTIEKLGYKLVHHRKFEHSIRTSNPTALYVIEKNASAKSIDQIRPACPYSKKVLTEYPDHFFSPESFLSYPKVNSIPCLAPFNAVLTSKNHL
ncbi:MAG: class I SAM-dependent methyltransferase [Cyclobacteriaceae bacterium]|nr:class I SAM-dependent methyltransferase [Cyclobacteriaceae bacterium]